jgi:regulatory protein
MKQLTYEQVLQRMADYCSRAERCIYDLHRKMRTLEIADTEQNKIIEYLQREKFIDESRYCSAFVNDKMRYNCWGAQKINYELKKKQLPETLIQEALKNIDKDANREQLCRLLQNKQRTIRGKNEYEIKQKLIRFAVGRGFSLEDIEDAFKILPAF